ncbi:MAG: hypothetical protein AAF628_07525 [Planctomycetota bacterium]
MRCARGVGSPSSEANEALLYDVAADIEEQHDVAARHPERVTAMRAAKAACQQNFGAGSTEQPR